VVTTSEDRIYTIYVSKYLYVFGGKKNIVFTAVLRYPGIQHGAGDPWLAMAELVSWDEKVTGGARGCVEMPRQPKQNQQRNTLEDEHLSYKSPIWRGK